MDAAAYKRMRTSQDLMFKRDRNRYQDEEESFWNLLEMATCEPVIQLCFSTMQSMCLSRDIDVVVKKKPSVPDFKRFLNMYYKPFLSQAIRCMMVCGFVPVRFRRITSGDVVPECLPLGSFRWTVVPNKLKNENDEEKEERDQTNTKNADDFESEEMHFISKFRPKYDDQSKLLKYKVNVISGNVKDNEIYVYEYMQPTFNVQQNSNFYATVNSPMAGLIHEYRDMRDAKRRRSMADAWNTRAHIVCTVKDQKVPTDQPRENFLASQLTLPSVMEEHQRFLASILNQETSEQRKIMQQIENEFYDNADSHNPLIHILPKNYDSQILGQLNPVEDTTQMQVQWNTSVFQLFKIPPKMMIGSLGLTKEAGLNQRIFSAEMQQLCNHLRTLSANVYSIIYSEKDPRSVNFIISPSPKIDIESIDDLKTLFEIGSIKPSMANRLADTLINADKDILGGIGGNLGGMPGVPGEFGAMKDRKQSKQDKDAGKIVRTELQYQAPKRATPAKLAPPPKEPAGSKPKK